MILAESTDRHGYKYAIGQMSAKGYRKRKNGYETFISNHSKSVSLGTYRTEHEAVDAVYKYRIERFENGCIKMGLRPDDGIVYGKKYIVFPSGDILNLYGEKIKGCTDRCGYREAIINGKMVLVHRVVATVFIPNDKGLEQINHIDGDKTNNHVSNLEWCSRSQNLLHAYANGLEKKMRGENHHAHKLTEDDVKHIKRVYKKRDKKYGAVPLGKLFGVDRTTILSVVNGRTWGEVI